MKLTVLMVRLVLLAALEGKKPPEPPMTDKSKFEPVLDHTLMLAA